MRDLPWSLPLKLKQAEHQHPINNTQPTEKHLWEICTLEQPKVGQTNESERWNRREEQKCRRKQPRAPCKIGSRGEFIGSFLALWSPKQSCLSNQHTPHRVAQWYGREQGRDWVWRAESWVIESGPLIPPTRNAPSTSCILPELPPSSRGICISRIETYTPVTSVPGPPVTQAVIRNKTAETRGTTFLEEKQQHTLLASLNTTPT